MIDVETDEEAICASLLRDGTGFGWKLGSSELY
jgi:hypothetical protein